MAKLSFHLIAALSLFITGCASIMTPTQMNTRRGTGTRGTIAGPPADVLNAFVESMQKAEYTVTREDNAAYATHSAGVNAALFIEPGSSEESTNAEILYLCSILGRELLRKSESGTLKAISNEVELKHLRRKVSGGGVVVKAPVPATEPDSAAASAPVAAEEATPAPPAPPAQAAAKPAQRAPPTPAEAKEIDEQLMP